MKLSKEAKAKLAKDGGYILSAICYSYIDDKSDYENSAVFWSHFKRFSDARLVASELPKGKFYWSLWSKRGIVDEW